MNSSASAMLSTIPDFSDMLELAEEIRKASVEKLKLELEIGRMESNVFKVAITEDKYMVGGKVPAVSFIKETYKHTGLSGEILPVRAALAEAVSKLEMLKRRFSMFEQMLDVWRTLSANERSANL